MVGSLFSGITSYVTSEIQKTAEIGKLMSEKAATKVQNYAQAVNSARSEASSQQNVALEVV